MMHCGVTILIIVPFEKRKVHNPECVETFVSQSESCTCSCWLCERERGGVERRKKERTHDVTKLSHALSCVVCLPAKIKTQSPG